MMNQFTNPPAFSSRVVEGLLLKQYGFMGDLKALPSERDQNVMVTRGDGMRFVLKIAHTAERPVDLETQNRVLRHLEQAGSPTPRLVLNLNGQDLGWIDSQDGNGKHGIRLLTFLPGRPLAQLQDRSTSLLEDLGAGLGRMDRSLAELGDSPINEGFPWDPASAFDIIGQHGALISDSGLRRLVKRFLCESRERLDPVLPRLPRSLIYNDANDHNVLVSRQRVSGLIDFGDMVTTWTVAELATACAYAVLGEGDTWAALGALVRGYNRERPLAGDETAVLFDLLCLRLCVSASMAAWQLHRRPDEAYLFVSQGPISRVLPVLLNTDIRFAQARMRHFCGQEAVDGASEVLDYLRRSGPDLAPVMPRDLRHDRLVILDLGIASSIYEGDPDANGEPDLTRRIYSRLESVGSEVAVGRYDEARLLYTSGLFRRGPEGSASRTVHLGIDLFMPAGTPVAAPLDGVVHGFARNREKLDYGPVIILEHRTDGDRPFYSLYGHLSLDSLRGLYPGKAIKKGQIFARLGKAAVNGGWTPHLHIQLILDPLGLGTDFPGVALPAERDFWCTLSPDANLLLGIPAERFPEADPPKAVTLAERKKRIGPSLSIGYEDPVKAVRGWMQYLYDEGGRRFLDCYNNVPHVGHCHPRVVDALRRQAGILATNTRYIHDHISRYAEKLTATLPGKLEVCFFLNSASEANELALRMARTITGQRDMIVLDAAYHGHTSALIDISPYKHSGPGGQGAPDWVHTAPLADQYRGKYKAGDAQAGEKYAADLGLVIEKMAADGRKPAGFIAESCPSVGGQIFFPDGYLREVYRLVRAAGGICIADEVQTGYGRIGTGFYAFEPQGVEPDMVILGKPIGNGHPLGALITTREIADAFHNGMEFFSTFGGNTVSSLVGLTVLDVVQEEKLQDHAQKVGECILKGLLPLVDKYSLVGDVRGSGLFLGVELVRDRQTLEPADREAGYLVNRLREQGILLGTDGPYHNVIKIRPPMPFDEGNADRLVDVLDRTIGELETAKAD
jgi:4-aminobutyrate aminotransferase-like enzyme/Ser/Thr protein kinase RdoA (MazF antagonist)